MYTMHIYICMYMQYYMYTHIIYTCVWIYMYISSKYIWTLPWISYNKYQKPVCQPALDVPSLDSFLTGSEEAASCASPQFLAVSGKMILAVNTTKSMLDYRRVYKQQIHQFTANKERDQIYILEAPRCQGTAKIPQFLGSPVSKWILQENLRSSWLSGVEPPWILAIESMWFI
jgi:hypothetical protein